MTMPATGPVAAQAWVQHVEFDPELARWSLRFPCEGRDATTIYFDLRPRSLRGDIPKDLERVVMKLLGLERALEGHEAGETLTAQIAPADGYGEREEVRSGRVYAERDSRRAEGGYAQRYSEPSTGPSMLDRMPGGRSSASRPSSRKWASSSAASVKRCRTIPSSCRSTSAPSCRTATTSSRR